MSDPAAFADDLANDPQRVHIAERATWASALVNLLLTVAQILVGWLAHSQSLIAHGLHSFSDLLSDFLVLVANRKGNHPADEGHPYGHARYETAATLILGVSLLLVGGGILWDAMQRLGDPAGVAPIGALALWVAIATVVAKEGLYRYLIAVADRLRSRLLAANALHTRADAASALVVVAGVGGSLLGWPFLDLVAAILMGGMILKLGGQLAWGALIELVDTGLEAEVVGTIRSTLVACPGVLGVHDLRTRRMAHRALVDAHLLVEPRISVSEGHRIAEEARSRVLAACPQVLDVLVHIDPEEDLSPSIAGRPPGRQRVLAELAPLLAEVPPPQRVVLHYLNNRVEAELFFAADDLGSDSDLAAVEGRLRDGLAAHPLIAGVSCHRTSAPK